MKFIEVTVINKRMFKDDEEQKELFNMYNIIKVSPNEEGSRIFYKPYENGGNSITTNFIVDIKESYEEIKEKLDTIK
jgi:hypothetical protein